MTALPESRTPSITTAERRHLLDLDDVPRDELLDLLELGRMMREVVHRPIPKVPALTGKTVVNLFFEDSTRTRVSFEIAGKYLSADVVNVTASSSSVNKGESLINTIKTLDAAGASIITLRHPYSGAPYVAAAVAKAAIINAGDGLHAHPTQALLDLLTMTDHCGPLDGKKVVIVGDILHSRVARSNLWGLTTMGAKVVVCGPPTLLPKSLPTGLPCAPTVSHDLDDAIVDADVVMALRLQSERMQRGLLPSLREYARLYQVNDARLARAKRDVLVMHPGPMNEGVEIDRRTAHGHRSAIEAQVANGVATRMAVLYLLSGAPMTGNGALRPNGARAALSPTGRPA